MSHCTTTDLWICHVTLWDVFKHMYRSLNSDPLQWFEQGIFKELESNVCTFCTATIRVSRKIEMYVIDLASCFRFHKSHDRKWLYWAKSLVVYHFQITIVVPISYFTWLFYCGTRLYHDTRLLWSILQWKLPWLSVNMIWRRLAMRKKRFEDNWPWRWVECFC